MRTNLLANQEHYRTNKQVKDKKQVLDVIEDYLRTHVNAEEGEFRKIFSDINDKGNHEIRIDRTDEMVQRHGVEGNRVAYGAFRHSAIVHSVQTVWTYTFEMIEDGDQIYLGADSWGWLADDNLSERVDTHLE